MAASTGSEPDGTRRGRARWWWIAGATAVIAAVVVAVLVWPRGGTTAESGPTAGSARPTSSDTASPQPTTTAPASGDPTPPVEAPPVGFDETAEVVPGVTFAISGLEAVEGEAAGRGEVAGPAIRFRLEIVNGTSEPVPLGTTVVNVFAGPDQNPAPELSGPGAEPFPAEAGAGGEASGVFVFNVPPDQRGDVTISVDYAVGVPVVVFHGAAPR